MTSRAVAKTDNKTQETSYSFFNNKKGTDISENVLANNPSDSHNLFNYSFDKVNVHKNSNFISTAPVVQPKLMINLPGDKYEQEADAMADKVMRMTVPSANQINFEGNSIQRKCDHCEEEEKKKKKIQRKETQSGEAHASNDLSTYVNNLSNTGTHLPQETRNFFEPRFGHDFSHVKVHTDIEAAESARTINAHAYTIGQNIVFGPGKFCPEKISGKRLIAHELAHVLQQKPISNSAIGRGLNLNRSNDSLELKAGKASAQALLGKVSENSEVNVDPIITRQEIDINLEVPTPSEREELRNRGIQLPQGSAASADPRIHSDYIDRRLTAVGYGIYLGGFLVYCNELPLPVFVPDSHVDFNQSNVSISNPSIYSDRSAALTAIPIGPPSPGQGFQMTFYRGAGGALIAPTFFSPATTPRFIETALRARRELAEQVQNELVVLAITLVGGIALRAIINRIARIGSGGPEPARITIPPGTGRAFGRQMAGEMTTAGFRGNPFREFMRRLNARPQRLPPQEAAEAIKVATTEYTQGNMGTMPPVQRGNILVVPSRAEILKAPVMGIRSDGTVIIGNVPRLEIVRNAQGVPVLPLQTRLIGDIVWE